MNCWIPKISGKAANRTSFFERVILSVAVPAAVNTALLVKLAVGPKHKGAS